MIVVAFDKKIRCLIVAFLLAGGAAAAQAQPADLALPNGDIVTLEQNASGAQGGAQALAARSGRIVAIGSNKTVGALIGRRRA